MNKATSSKLLTSMMHGMITHNFDPRTDNVSINHLTDYKQYNGGIKNLLAKTSFHFECETYHVLKDKQTGQTNEIIIHYLTTNKQSLNLTVVDLYAMLDAYDLTNQELIDARSIIRPITDANVQKLVSKGIASTTKHNVKHEFLKLNYPLCYKPL